MNSKIPERRHVPYKTSEHETADGQVAHLRVRSVPNHTSSEPRQWLLRSLQSEHSVLMVEAPKIRT